jgi:hypothetical protein
MADEHTQIVQPGRGIEDVVVERLSLGKRTGEGIQPGLVAEFIGWLRLGAYVFGDGRPVIGLIHRRSLPPDSRHENR